MTAVLGLHGIGNYHRDTTASTLSTRWATALRSGFGPTVPDIELTVAYYAPALRSAATPQGNEADPDRLDPATQDLIRQWLTLHDPPTAVAQGRATAPLRRALEWVADRYGLDQRLTRLFVSKCFIELAAYLNPDDPAPRHAAQQIVRDEITSHQPRVVIAHSLGSVVAYEALCTMPDYRVDLLLTLGSPLAMPDVVYPKIQPTPPTVGRAPSPPCVRTWINIADPGDLVAVPRHLSRHFTGIHADLTPPISVFDFHKVHNYLANPTTAAALLPYLTRDDEGPSR